MALLHRLNDLEALFIVLLGPVLDGGRRFVDGVGTAGVFHLGSTLAIFRGSLGFQWYEVPGLGMSFGLRWLSETRGVLVGQSHTLSRERANRTLSLDGPIRTGPSLSRLWENGTPYLLSFVADS